MRIEEERMNRAGSLNKNALFGAEEFARVNEYIDYSGAQRLILGLSVCKSNTTASLFPFSRLPEPWHAADQIGKSIARLLLDDDPNCSPEVVHLGDLHWKDRLVNYQNYPDDGGYASVDTSFDVAETPFVYNKETLGPHNVAECSNWLEAFRQHPSLDHVYIHIKDLATTWISYTHMFLDRRYYDTTREDLFDNFIVSLQTMKKIIENLESDGTPHTIFAQELYRGTDVRQRGEIMQKLFARAQIGVSLEQAVHTVTDWQDGSTRKIYQPKEPPYNAEALDAVWHSHELFYREPDPQRIKHGILPYELDRLHDEGFCDFYDRLRRQSGEELQVGLNESNDFPNKMCSMKAVFA